MTHSEQSVHHVVGTCGQQALLPHLTATPKIINTTSSASRGEMNILMELHGTPVCLAGTSRHCRLEALSEQQQRVAYFGSS